MLKRLTFLVELGLYMLSMPCHQRPTVMLKLDDEGPLAYP